MADSLVLRLRLDSWMRLDEAVNIFSFLSCGPLVTLIPLLSIYHAKMMQTNFIIIAPHPLYQLEVWYTRLHVVCSATGNQQLMFPES